MRNLDHSPDPDDLFAETRMSFGDHIEELRHHLWRAILGFLVGLVISFFIGWSALRFISAPVERELNRFYQKRVEKIAETLHNDEDPHLQEMNNPREFEVQVNPKGLARTLGLPEPAGEEWISMPLRLRPLDWAIANSEAGRLVGKPAMLATMNITEAFVVYFKVCMVCAVIIGSPWIFWQLWQFIAAGLYPHERRYVHLYLPFSLLLFLGGFFLCEFLVIPQAIRILLEFNEWIGLEPDLRLNEWLSFALLLPLIFGLSFQTPLVMLFMAKMGIMDVDSFRRKRKIAWFVMAIFAAVITPTPDALTMTFMWVPMCLLYELGIYLARSSSRVGGLDMDVPEPEEMVEV